MQDENLKSLPKNAKHQTLLFFRAFEQSISLLGKAVLRRSAWWGFGVLLREWSL